MIENKNIAYYLFTIILFIIFKFAFTFADNDNLTFLLRPTNNFVELLTGSQSVYHSDNGYFHDELNILIDKSCSGFNFWLLSFLMLTFLALKHFDKHIYKALVIPTMLILAYFLTLFVNSSRIFTSIIIQNQTNHLLNNGQHIIHEAIGVITNLSFLILAYFITEKLLLNRKHNAKLT